MLTLDAFKLQFSELREIPLVPCPHEWAGGHEVGDSEAFAFLYVDFKNRYRGLAHFLINTYRSEQWPLTLEQGKVEPAFLFQPMSVSAFLKDFLLFWTLRHRQLLPNDEPLNVTLLENDWNEQSALAEYPQHFLYVAWGTGA